jgi:succinate dehydrogenase/fumarate reductase flavoprotein subunit
MNPQRIETDVLVIGGGLGGCMAAIAARRRGAKVTVMEKSHVDRSGAAGSGNDHFWHWNPDIHPGRGWTVEKMVRDISWDGEYGRLSGGIIDQELTEVVAAESYARVRDLESIGVKFRFDEIHPWNLQYEAPPGEPRLRIIPQFQSEWDTLNYEGRDIKPKLAAELRRLGVVVLNRVMATRILSSGGSASGAVGVSQRTGEAVVVEAPSVVLASGMDMSRLYRSPSGDWFNSQRPPMITGDGEAMAIRAGAEVFIRPPGRTRNTGLQHFKGLYRSSGAATTSYPAGRIVDAEGGTIIEHPAAREPMRKRREELECAVAEGRTPIYLDLTHASEEEIRYAEWSYGHEGLCWVMLEAMRDLGLDFRRDALELEVEETGRHVGGRLGVWINPETETSLPGLYAASPVQPAGEVSAPIPVVLGYRAGERAAARAEGAQPHIDESEVEAELERITAPLGRTEGSTWREANIALNDVTEDFKRLYAGFNPPPARDRVSQPGLRSLSERLAALKADPIKAADPHELVRALEVLNLIEVAGTLVEAASDPRLAEPGTWFLARRREGATSFRSTPIAYKYPRGAS